MSARYFCASCRAETPVEFMHEDGEGYFWCQSCWRERAATVPPQPNGGDSDALPSSPAA